MSGSSSTDKAGGGAADGVGNGGGEGSSSNTGGRRRAVLETLDDVMREPSMTLPDVVVLDSIPDGLERREVLDPREDLWLSTSDGYVRSARFFLSGSMSHAIDMG